MVTPRMLVRLRKGLRRLDFGAAEAREPADRAFKEMLARVAAEDAERRLAALAEALDEGARRNG